MRVGSTPRPGRAGQSLPTRERSDLTHLQDLLPHVRDVAVKAGLLIERIQREGYEAKSKEDNSPVTRADREADGDLPEDRVGEAVAPEAGQQLAGQLRIPLVIVPGTLTEAELRVLRHLRQEETARPTSEAPAVLVTQDRFKNEVKALLPNGLVKIEGFEPSWAVQKAASSTLAIFIIQLCDDAGVMVSGYFLCLSPAGGPEILFCDSRCAHENR